MGSVERVGALVGGRPDFDILEQILVMKIKLTESEKLKGWQVDELQGSNQAGKLSEDFLKLDEATIVCWKVIF